MFFNAGYLPIIVVVSVGLNPWATSSSAAAVDETIGVLTLEPKVSLRSPWLTPDGDRDPARREAAPAADWPAAVGPVAYSSAELPSRRIEPEPARIANAPYTIIADKTTTVPGYSTAFTGFYSPVVSGSNVSFLGVYDAGGGYLSGYGIYTGVAGTTGVSRIADVSTTAPGRGTVFTDFNYPVISGSNVAFTGYYDAGSGRSTGSGIYTGVAGAAGVTRIADPSTVVPGRSTVFTSVDYPAISGNNVVFYGNYSTGSGIYSGTVGTSGASLIADTSTAVPGASSHVFSSLGLPIVSGSNVAFTANYDAGSGTSSGRGIYTGVVGTVGATRVADNFTTVPGRSVLFDSFDSPVLSGNNVAFYGFHSDGQNGIYTTVIGTSVLRRVVDDLSVVPRLATYFTSFGDPVISGNNLAFPGTYNAGRGIYTGVVGTTGATGTVVDSTTSVPGQSAVFSSFSTLAISGGNVAFVGSYSGGSGIFLFHDGSLLDVAETGEALFGSTVSSLGFVPAGLDGNDITFRYFLANGGGGELTVVVPEPSTTLGGALLLVAAGMRLRRRHFREV